MKYNPKFLSRLGHRGTFSLALMDLAKEDVYDKLAVFTADLGVLSGLTRFMNEFPNKFYNVGIAEQNMIGVASGMAKDGFKCFVTTYANFITMRSFEQIRMNLAYMKLNVKVIGTGGGVCMAMSGNSHYGLEDIAIMRALPNMTIVCPCDGLEIMEAIKAAYEYDGPVYIRLTGNQNQPIIYSEKCDFKIGKSIKLKEGKDVTILAHGTMVNNALKTAELLEQSNVSATVIDMHTIKPLDKEMIDSLFNHKLIVTVEEHSIIGGLGGAVAEYISSKKNNPRLVILGINDEYPKAAEYDYLIDKFGLSPQKIYERIINELNGD